MKIIAQSRRNIQKYLQLLNQFLYKLILKGSGFPSFWNYIVCFANNCLVFLFNLNVNREVYLDPSLEFFVSASLEMKHTLPANPCGRIYLWLTMIKTLSKRTSMKFLKTCKSFYARAYRSMKKCLKLRKYEKIMLR